MPITVTTTADYYQVVNGLTGIRIARHSPDLGNPVAPVAGLRWRSGAWTATEPNYLHSRSWYDFPKSPAPPCTGMVTTILEQTATKVVVEVVYSFDRPVFEYPDLIYFPAGPGFLKTTITVLDNEPVIMFEEDSDCDVGYSFSIYDGLAPDQARYRGHSASEVQYGRDPEGERYRAWNERAPCDATVDLDYNVPRSVSYRANTDGNQDTRPPMATWYPWIYDSGWYWQLYNAAAPDTANLFGIFAGPASRIIGGAAVGAGIYHGPGDSAGVVVELNRASPSLQASAQNRFSWGIYVSTKANLYDPYQIQPINLMMNKHGGLATKLTNYEVDFVDPVNGYGTLFMGKEAMDRLTNRVQGNYTEYQRLWNVEAYARNLIDLWYYNTPEAVQQIVDQILNLAADLKYVLTSDEGIYSPRFHYIQGGQEMSRMGIFIDQVLANEHVTPEQKLSVKKAASLFANILWDNDYVPFQGNVNVTFGTGNMPVQHQGFRDFYAVYLGADDAWEANAFDALTRGQSIFNSIVNEYGASMSSTGYINAGAWPTLNIFLQALAQGLTDPFATEPRFAKFGEFLLNMLTPPEGRFGGLRKLACFGNGWTGGNAIFGALATGLRPSNPDLAAKLQKGWVEQGSPHEAFFGTTLVMIDEEAPTQDFTLGNAVFPGYYRVQRGKRYGVESSVWMIDGDFYRDHRVPDQGMIVYYALGVPLSLSITSIYYPPVGGGLWYSALQPETEMGEWWGKPDLPLSQGNAWYSAGTEPGTFSDGAWKRNVKLVSVNGRYCLAAQDISADPYIWTLNIMAQDKIVAPNGGTFTPPPHPLAPKVMKFKAGAHRFKWTGQWGVNGDLWLIADEDMDVAWSSWTHYWAPVVEASQFRSATGREWEEKQYTVRVRTKGRFRWVMFPYHNKWLTGTVAKTSAGLTIAYGGPGVAVKF